MVCGSHRWDERGLSAPVTMEQSAAAVMPKGSVLLYTGSTFHGGGRSMRVDARACAPTHARTFQRVCCMARPKAAALCTLMHMPMHMSLYTSIHMSTHMYIYISMSYAHAHAYVSTGPKAGTVQPSGVSAITIYAITV